VDAVKRVGTVAMATPRRKERRPKFAVCVWNDGYASSLELRKLYQFWPDEQAARHRQIRVIDESGEDFLYPQAYFVPIKLSESTQKAVVKAHLPRLCS
jgi:hypothetical protein